MAAVLVPYQPTDEHRRRAWTYVRAQLAAAAPPWSLIVATGVDGPWCKAAAVDVARGFVRDPVYVIHDADVIVDESALRAAVEAVEQGAAWAVPHTTVYRLSEQTTAEVYESGFPIRESRAALARPAYLGFTGGGVTVVRADVYDQCPLDPRFVGWGGEDESWGAALACLFGPAWRGDAALWHLWHPHAAPGARHASTVDGERLRRAYKRARGNPEAMRAVIGSARDGR